MFLRFTGLFLAWSIVVGLVIYAARFNVMLSFAIVSTWFGALLGLIAVAVALLYGDVHNHREFKKTLAVCTSALPAYLVAFFLHIASLFGISSSADVIFSLSIVSVFPITILFSQIVARHYLREISPRKQKPA